MENRKKIFEDNTVVVEEVIKTPTKKQKLKVNFEETENKNIEDKTIGVSDIIDTFAGYLPTQANFMDKDGGECLLCGKETTSSMRKICFDCLQNKGKTLYKKAKKAIETGNKYFSM